MRTTRRDAYDRARLTARAAVMQAFAAVVRSRGDAYFAQRKVDVVRTTPSAITAVIHGGSAYDAQLRFTPPTGVLDVWCSCPFGDRFAAPCKHLWAVLRLVDEHHMLPEAHRSRNVSLKLQNDLGPNGEHAEVVEDSLEPTVAAEPGALTRSGRAPRADDARNSPAVLDRMLLASVKAPRPAADQRKLAALLEHGSSGADGARLRILSEVAGGYVDVTRSTVIQSGRPGTLEGDLALLAARDATALDWDRGAAEHSSECRVTLRSEELRPVLLRLAEAGRLLVLSKRNAVIPVTLSAAPARLILAAIVDGQESAYRLTGRVDIGDRAVELDAVSFCHVSGIVLVGSDLAVIEGAIESQWLDILFEEGQTDVILDAPELERFLEEYFGQDGLPTLVLPPGLELPEIEAVPVRFADIGASDGSSLGLPMRAGMRYGDREVSLSTTRRWAVDLVNNRRHARDRELEKQSVATLDALGVRGSTPTVTENGAGEATFRVGAKRALEVAQALFEQGWRVSIERRAYRQLGRVHLRGSSGIDWFAIDGTVEVDGQELPLGELLRALTKQRRTGRLVELGADTIAVLPEALLGRIERMLDLGAELDRETGALKLRRAHAGAALALLAQGTTSEADAPLEALHQALSGGTLPTSSAPPRGFHGTLRGYQRDGLGWLRWLAQIGFGGCLADDMGLGKTVQVLALLLGRGRKHGPSLVVVPRSVLHNWADEAARFAPALAPIVHWGTERTSDPAHLAGARMVITTYATLARDTELLQQVAWDYLVVDEAQVIKNPKTQSARLLRRIGCQHRLALTGTPLENHLDELWALLDFLNPGFGRRLPVRGDVLDETERSLVSSLIKPFVLRRTKAQVARDLPERVEQTLEVELSRPERRRYDELHRHLRREYTDAVGRLGAQRSTPVLLTGLLRLRQAACHQGLIDEKQRGQPSAKLLLLLDRLTELRDEGSKALVFSQFTKHLDLVQDALRTADIGFARLDGKTRNRAERVKAFQEDPSLSVFLISLKAGGTGLNLTAAEYVFLLDPWWNPAAEAQAIDRCHRIGQTSRVMAYRLIAAGTVEEKVAKLQQRKRELFDAVFGDESAFLGKLSRDDLELLLEG